MYALEFFNSLHVFLDSFSNIETKQTEITRNVPSIFLWKRKKYKTQFIIKLILIDYMTSYNSKCDCINSRQFFYFFVIYVNILRVNALLFRFTKLVLAHFNFSDRNLSIVWHLRLKVFIKQVSDLVLF